jgi:hypothetical protein
MAGGEGQLATGKTQVAGSGSQVAGGKWSSGRASATAGNDNKFIILIILGRPTGFLAKSANQVHPPNTLVVVGKTDVTFGE